MLTQKQEAFCIAYVEGGSAADAYRKAGYSPKMSDKTVHEAASRLLKNSKVDARIDELRKPVAEAAQVTLSSHLSRLEALSTAAEQAGQYSAAIAAEVSRGKVSGLYIDKSEVTGKDGAPLQQTIIVLPSNGRETDNQQD